MLRAIVHWKLFIFLLGHSSINSGFFSGKKATRIILIFSIKFRIFQIKQMRRRLKKFEKSQEQTEIIKSGTCEAYISYYFINNIQMQGKTMMALGQHLLGLANKNKQTKTPIQSQQEANSDKKQVNNSLTLSYMIIQKLPLPIKKIFQQHYQNLLELTITNCDLRTFENFPKLKIIRKLNVSKNSLRGSFEFVVKNRTLKYIDVSQNIIADIKRFQPLRCIKDISVYAKSNPFDSKNREDQSNLHSSFSKSSIIEQFKNMGIKYLDKPLNQQPKEIVKKEQKQKIVKPCIPPITNKKQTPPPAVENRRQRRDYRSIHEQMLENAQNIRERIREATTNSRNSGTVPEPRLLNVRSNDQEIEQQHLFMSNLSSQSEQNNLNLEEMGLIIQQQEDDNDQDDQLEDQLDMREGELFDVLQFSDRALGLYNSNALRRMDSPNLGQLQSEQNQQEQDDDQDDQDDQQLLSDVQSDSGPVL